MRRQTALLKLRANVRNSVSFVSDECLSGIEPMRFCTVVQNWSPISEDDVQVPSVFAAMGCHKQLSIPGT